MEKIEIIYNEQVVYTLTKNYVIEATKTELDGKADKWSLEEIESRMLHNIEYDIQLETNIDDVTWDNERKVDDFIIKWVYFIFIEELKQLKDYNYYNY